MGIVVHVVSVANGECVGAWLWKVGENVGQVSGRGWCLYRGYTCTAVTATLDNYDDVH